MYYLHVILLIWTILTRTSEIMCTNKLGKMCDVIRVVNITDFSVEVRNSENDPYFSRFLYGVSKFLDFFRILQFFDFFTKFFNFRGSENSVIPPHFRVGKQPFNSIVLAMCGKRLCKGVEKKRFRCGIQELSVSPYLTHYLSGK